jgi:hypothetical protein
MLALAAGPSVIIQPSPASPNQLGIAFWLVEQIFLVSDILRQ